MANHKTRNIPGRLKTLAWFTKGQWATTRELAHLLKEPVRDVSSCLHKMEKDGELEKISNGSLMRWRRPQSSSRRWSCCPWLRPSGMRFLEQLERERLQ